MFGGVNQEDFLFELHDKRSKCLVDRQTARVTMLDIPAFESDYLSRFGFPEAAKLLVEEDLKRIYSEAEGNRLNTLTAASAYDIEDTVKGPSDDDEDDSQQDKDKQAASKNDIDNHKMDDKPASQQHDNKSDKKSSSIKASVNKAKPEVILEDVSIGITIRSRSLLLQWSSSSK